MKKTIVIFLFIVICKFGFASSDKLLFEENKGQWNKSILFKLGLKNIDILYEKNSITFQLSDLHELLSNNHPKTKSRLIADKATAYFYNYNVEFVESNKHVKHMGSDVVDTYNNYYLGNNPEQWVSGVQLFEGISYANLYNGVDLKIYSQDSRPKYDFVVRAGTNASVIAMRYTGARDLLLENGNLIVKTSLGQIIEKEPFAYQLIEGKKVEVKCNYLLHEDVVSFTLPNGYDKKYNLIIDPVLVGSTYSGSTADNWGFTATYDNQGNMYAGGIATNTRSSGGTGGLGNYVTTPGAFQVSFGGGGVGGISPDPWDIVITKYNSDGSSRIYSTYLGGSENDYPHSMVVNNNDELYVYGKTYSTNFPVSTNAYSKTIKGKADIIVTKFNAAGSALLGSTYIGGAQDDGVNFDADEFIFGNLKYNYGDDARGEIIVSQNDECYIASSTKSPDFPTTAGAYKTTYNGGGQDGCVFKFNSDLSSLLWSTFYGGVSWDACYSLALDDQENVYTSGGTMSSNFPSTTGALNPTYIGAKDGFAGLIKNDGSALLASTLIGTASYDQCYFVQTDKSNNVYLFGQTEGVYPTTAGVYKSAKGGLFIHKLNSTLTTTIFSTIIGDGINSTPNISPSAFLVDNCGNIYISGWGGKCNSSIGLGGQRSTTGLPVTANAYQSSTDGCDFYLMSLSKNAATLLYATFFGAGSSVHEHVDGGTSRFDKKGVVYQSVCAGCGNSDAFPTTPTAVSKINSSNNCNNAIFKMDFQTPNVVALASTVGVVGCAPLTYTFINGSANASTYQWDFDDGSPIDTTVAPSHLFEKAGTYNVKIIATNPNTCNVTDSATVLVTVKPGPKVDLGVDYDLTCTSLSDITLDAGSPGSTILWNTGETTQTIKPVSSGKYWVNATYSGCSTSDTIELIAPAVPTVTEPNIPNVFTPNGDNLNETFKIVVNGVVSEFNIKIYNRWGRLMFESDDINKFVGWKIEW